MRTIKKSSHDNNCYYNLVHDGRVHEHADLGRDDLLMMRHTYPARNFIFMYIHYQIFLKLKTERAKEGCISSLICLEIKVLKFWGCSNGSVVNACSCEGFKFISKGPRVAHNCLQLQFQDARDTQTLLQAKHSYTQTKINRKIWALMKEVEV